MRSLWDKAREAAADAQLLYEHGSFDGACNRAYYAMFNGAGALLIERGVDANKVKTHASVLRLFSLHFAKNDQIEGVGRALAQAGRARNEADYTSSITQPDVIEDVMTSLHRFMSLAEQILEKSDAEGSSDS